MSKPNQRKRKRKSFFDMTARERERDVERFDNEIDIERDTKPLTAAQRMLFERMRGVDVRSLYPLQIDPGLMSKASKEAKRRGVALDEFIVQGIRGMLAFRSH